MNAGVNAADLKREFGSEPVERAMVVVERLERDGMVATDGGTVRLTATGRLLSNDVFQEFLGVVGEETVVANG
jgi:coproporphyrinogen III oxidase-like Fe-S oxidoreductase